jgi:hypothetical protein
MSPQFWFGHKKTHSLRRGYKLRPLFVLGFTASDSPPGLKELAEKETVALFQ